jgi:hypothetical protein
LNELQLLHRFHGGTGEAGNHGTGGYPIVKAIELWWKMPIETKEALQAKWAAEDAEKRGKK